MSKSSVPNFGNFRDPNRNGPDSIRMKRVPRRAQGRKNTEAQKVKWGGSSRWSFGPNSALGGIESTTIGKTRRRLNLTKASSR